VWKLSPEYLDEDALVEIIWDFENESEFLHLAQLKMLLDHYGVKSRLKIMYLPYARQDKLIDNSNTFALHTFAKLLNSLEFQSIEIEDPHSILAIEKIKNSRATYRLVSIHNAFSDTKSDIVCYPDKGAVSKYVNIVGLEPWIHGEKERDQSTGKIIKYNLIGDVKDKKVLVVDDICDGGMTFVLLSKVLYESGAREVHLFVSHGIFSKGIQILKDAGIQRIFTKDGEINDK